MVDKTVPEVEAISPALLNKLTKSELVEFARMSYGLNLNIEQPKGELVDFIMNAARRFKGNAEMRVVDMNAEVEVPKGYVKIRVTPGTYNPNGHPIPIGLNFRLATVPVNKDVVMHGRWLPCLQDAVERRYSVGRNPMTGKEELIWNDQHKYPFTIIVDNR